MFQSFGIKRYGMQGLKELVASWGEPEFRVTQLLYWLYGQGARDYQQMSNLPNKLRAKLEAEEPLFFPEVLRRRVSADKTRKYLLRLADGAKVETVGIPTKGRLTVCFSTQSGCAMGCAFCATGSGGFTRSLKPGEMVDQITVVSQDFGARVTNAVAMGEGEPFANYEATLAALRIMNAHEGLKIGARHLCVSSCGLLGPLRRFSQEPEQFTLAISLHSAVQTTRNALMPALASQPLEALRSTLIAYTEKTGRRPSLEFAPIAGVNDTARETAALIAFARGMLCHVNLIPLNPLGKEPTVIPTMQGVVLSASDAIGTIAAQLRKAGIECTIRNSRGSDIEGACGQLKSSVDLVVC